MNSNVFDAFLDELAERVAQRIATREPSGEHVYEAELVAAIGSRDRARRLIRSGAIVGSVIGRRLVANRRSLEAFIESNRVRQREPDVDPIDDVVARAGLRAVAGGKR
jgi:hypothetical protein